MAARGEMREKRDARDERRAERFAPRSETREDRVIPGTRNPIYEKQKARYERVQLSFTASVILEREERPSRGSLGSLLFALCSRFSILDSQSAALSIRSKRKKPLSFDRGLVLFR
ncbi:hypothetical protein VII00023_08809 [Vibrio ichthyoenteri ATCC 700023]|uniref:Uncharacterized protein n=1 Tax=Vibrio ichthyoenteri ATCC 700023 TaxID=870968 RepID=F9S022_9VIBR|nr:hypothetical protein VII00023_08809 [Vibrio ichthyoenteri ATCC 700023]